MADASQDGKVTVLLHAWAQGDEEAGNKLFPLIYGQLRQISEVQLRRHPAQVTIRPTEILHEAYIRLADQKVADWKSRAHFFALGATVIRRVLLDHARYRLAERRDRRAEVELGPEHDRPLMSSERADEVVQLHESLTALAAVDPRRAQVVELRYFGGLDVTETAEVMGTSTATVKRDWALARAWLRRHMENTGDDGL